MKASFFLAVLLSTLVLNSFGPIRVARAQSLDDAIDAELDEVSGDGPAKAASTPAKAPAKPSASENSTESAPKTASAPPASSLDDIQLDAGRSAVEAPAPATGPDPAEGLVEDELKLDDEPAAQQAQTPEPAAPADSPEIKPDIKLDEPALEPAMNEPVEAPPTVPTEPLNQKRASAPQNSPSAVSNADSVEIDGGNAAYEKRLSHFAKGYKQVPDVSWDDIVGERRQEDYSLQSRDTLWDISETFFGDGLFWAKLWSQNGVIGNPHHILRGKEIRFVAGTESEAPAIGIVDANAVKTNPFEEPQAEAPLYREQVPTDVTAEETESGVVLEDSELIPAPDLPPPSQRMPVLKKLPNSFAETHPHTDADYDASGLNGAPAILANAAATMFANSLILDGEPREIGHVDEIETQERVAGVGQSVFFNSRIELKAGKRLTFIRRREHPKNLTGPVIDIEGIGVVDGIVKESTNTYHVTITTSILPVEKGALAIEDPPPKVTLSRTGRRSDARVKVVGGEFDEQRRNLGTSSIVYLSGGANQGLQPGDILGIQSRRGLRRDTKYPDYHQSIAVIKIVDVRQKVATAMVLTSTSGIMIGDTTGAELPEDLPALHAQSTDDAVSDFGQKNPANIK